MDISKLQTSEKIDIAKKILEDLADNYEPFKNIQEAFDKTISTDYKYGQWICRTMRTLGGRTRFINNSDLSKIISEKHNNDIILYVAGANQYVLFNDYMNYYNFLTSLESRFEELKENTPQVYQIVFGGEKQKLIFSYVTSTDKIDNELHVVSDRIQKYLSCPTDIRRNEHYKCYQIVVDKFINNYDESERCLQEVCNFINKTNPEIVNGLHTFYPTSSQGGNEKYIYVNIDATPHGEPKDRDALKNLVYIPENFGGKCVININNPIIITGGNNNTNNINTAAPNVDLIAQEWIKAQPPEDKESTKGYYNKYVIYATNIKIGFVSMQKFTPMVCKQGYKRSSDGAKRIWTRIKK